MARYRSNEAWQALFAEYEASPESARDFCMRHGLQLGYFYRRSRELQGRSAIRTGRQAFVPVAITPTGPRAEITLTIGPVSLALSSGVPPAWVAGLLKALEA